MSTILYLVRHAQSDWTVADEESRPLTPKGQLDADRLPGFFADITIDAAYSSPYVRTVQTVAGVAAAKGLELQILPGLRERAIGAWFNGKAEFDALVARQWADQDYKLPGGESITEVKSRYVREIDLIANKHAGGAALVGTHGTVLCTLLSHHDPRLDFAAIQAILALMPGIFRLTWDAGAFVSAERLDFPVD